ncbi:hypothetical protein ILUMI_11694 [Ignelater luminosus]|uniref:MD-2-related lipid-recognition domain-containing protein n=1 Tax=Ignelater luminosus TaxID=2038154 RepID=A0A8K0GCH7_IGNLU|nr:hypothetical protein ILUMI_11694 [Ignelater luminosus]
MSVHGIAALFVFTYIFLPITCIQNGYTFIPEHCEIKKVNRSLVHVGIAKCYKLSRTELYLNFTGHLLVDILNDHMGQVKITGFQFRSNEYRQGPIEFMLGLCSAILSDQFDIPHMLSNSNVKCPIKKRNELYVYKVSPNATNMPPLIPEGRWKLQIDFLYLNKYLLGSVEWYTGVEYINKFFG